MAQEDFERKLALAVLKAKDLETSSESSHQSDEPELPELPDGGLPEWCRVFAAFFFIMNTWGLINSFGAWQTYYESINLSGQSSSTISWIGTTQTFLVEIVGIIAGPLFDQGYLYSILVPGCVLNVVGMMTLSLSSTYWQVFLSQGVCTGLGGGLLYVLSLAIIVPVFTKKRPLAIGVATSATSIGGVVYPIIFRRLEAELGFAWTVRVIAVIELATFSISFIFLRMARIDTTPKEARALFDTKALKEIPFLTYLIALLTLYAGYFVAAFFIPTYATKSLDLSADMGFYMLAIDNAASLAGRFLPQIVPRCIGQGMAFIVCTGAGGLVILAWLGVHNLGGFIAFCVIYGILSGAILTLTTVMIPELSPQGSLKEIGTRMGMVYASVGFGGLIGSPIAAALSSPTQGRFVGAQIWGGATQVVGAALLVVPWWTLRRKGT